MATGDINNKSAKKHIRFPHELIEEINSCVEIEKSADESSNFSAWVIDACEKKLSKPKLQKKK
ncbi:YlcI/YnfO family protein [Xenorhabdus bovienii]|uniref:YlcI/YnfO family protein n=1 Tax=Xenorhabdus bovienii TaxID=40576 RepID=UPI00056F0972|nr:YlcI/YnfO family protein [Xenorhabdus bovienii]